MGRKATLELVLDCSDPETLMPFWREALGYRLYYSDPSLVVLVPQDVNASPLLLQRVPESKAGKNRMHLDIVAEDVEIEVERLEALGARRLHDGVPGTRRGHRPCVPEEGRTGPQRSGYGRPREGTAR